MKDLQLNGMRELSFKEVEDVSGGIAPIIGIGLAIGGGALLGAGVSWAINRWF